MRTPAHWKMPRGRLDHCPLAVALLISKTAAPRWASLSDCRNAVAAARMRGVAAPPTAAADGTTLAAAAGRAAGWAAGEAAGLLAGLASGETATAVGAAD